MTTWDEVLAYLRARYALDAEMAGWAALSWRFADEDGVPFAQHQTVRLGGAGGEPFLIIASEVTAGSRLSAEEALRHNATLAVGALALEDGRCLLRHGVFLGEATTETLDRALSMVAHEAARLSQRVWVRLAPVVYEHYCD